uniref:MAX dimerization protein 1 n=1 Tax=Sinocyclocheilus anshuiensis TaxID=1608454 RepID=A0A671MQ20_9TELE
MTAVLNIQRLLEAAEYIERRERESEHGYASTFPSVQHSSCQRQRKLRNKKCSNNHNNSQRETAA